jgi:hypothetical protein
MRVGPSTGKSSNSSSSSSGATDSFGFSASASLGGMLLFLVVDMVVFWGDFGLRNAWSQQKDDPRMGLGAVLLRPSGAAKTDMFPRISRLLQHLDLWSCVGFSL